MATHKFKVGQTVLYAPSQMERQAGRIDCKIVELLPAEPHGEPQYRIKCRVDVFDRTAMESQLTKLA